MPRHAQRQRLDPLQDQPCAVRAHARAEVAQALAARAQQERADAALVGEHHAVKAVVRRGEFGEPAVCRVGRMPVELPAVDQHAADHGAVAREKLGRRVEDEVGAMIEGLHQPGRREGRVDQQWQTVLVGERRDCGQVEHVEPGVAERLAEQQLRGRADRGAPGVDVAGLHERGLDAEAPQGVVQQVVRAAVQRARTHDVRARAGERRDREVQCCLAAGGRDRADPAFERGNALLEHRIGRIRDAAVDVARALHVEQRRSVLAVFEHERGRQVDRHGARAGGRVGRGAGMQRERVEAGV